MRQTNNDICRLIRNQWKICLCHWPERSPRDGPLWQLHLRRPVVPVSISGMLVALPSAPAAGPESTETFLFCSCSCSSPLLTLTSAPTPISMKCPSLSSDAKRRFFHGNANESCRIVLAVTWNLSGVTSVGRFETVAPALGLHGLSLTAPNGLSVLVSSSSDCLRFKNNSPLPLHSPPPLQMNFFKGRVHSFSPNFVASTNQDAEIQITWRAAANHSRLDLQSVRYHVTLKWLISQRPFQSIVVISVEETKCRTRFHGSANQKRGNGVTWRDPTNQLRSVLKKKIQNHVTGVGDQWKGENTRLCLTVKTNFFFFFQKVRDARRRRWVTLSAADETRHIWHPTGPTGGRWGGGNVDHLPMGLPVLEAVGNTFGLLISVLLVCLV